MWAASGSFGVSAMLAMLVMQVGDAHVGLAMWAVPNTVTLSLHPYFNHKRGGRDSPAIGGF